MELLRGLELKLELELELELRLELVRCLYIVLQGREEGDTLEEVASWTFFSLMFGVEKVVTV